MDNPLPSPPLKQSKLSPLYQIVLPKNQHNLTPDSLLYTSKLRSRDQQPILTQSRKTKPIIWCGAVLCMLFSILIIFLGIATLIIYVAIQPKSPIFDTPASSVRAIYFNPPQFLNGDIAFLANFSNPNKRLRVRFEQIHVDLYFYESLIASQILVPFSEGPGEARLVSIRLLIGAVYLPMNLGMELQKQAVRNRIVYDMKGAFRVRFKTGLVHYSYWMHADCRLEMTSPPNSVLITHSCTTKK
ncbi:hypothetical protein CASFOL_020069 [Castilleja foliolosa]|uniref:Late embryogenesis abundant protein LEA-2 subgroup domain-containing protein n=1 Tax=Castilleja foliolosa TaxID=1961234 RepID=A0ABD3D3Z8_9LAMI